MPKNALTRLFDYGVNQESPLQKDVVLVKKVDEDGKIYTVFEEVDYPKLQKSHGSVSDWSLSALLQAGINPDFPIHTGLPSRIEGVSAVQQFEAAADSILEPVKAE